MDVNSLHGRPTGDFKWVTDKVIESWDICKVPNESNYGNISEFESGDSIQKQIPICLSQKVCY